MPFLSLGYVSRRHLGCEKNVSHASYFQVANNDPVMSAGPLVPGAGGDRLIFGWHGQVLTPLWKQMGTTRPIVGNPPINLRYLARISVKFDLRITDLPQCFHIRIAGYRHAAKSRFRPLRERLSVGI